VSDTSPAQPLTKREREAIVLRMIYPVDQFARVEHVDSPGFILARARQEPFGVEATELCESEGQARLHNRPTYFTQLNPSGDCSHKDDRTALPVSTFTVTDPEGTVKHESLPGIITPRPTLEERRRSLAHAIRRENEKHAAYRDKLSHMNLIIYDHNPNDNGVKDEYPSEDVLGDEVHSVLAESASREIFLVNRYRGGAHGYRPLRMLSLLEQFRLFVETAESEFFDSDDLSRIVVAFRDMMRHRGFAIGMVESDGALCAIHWGVAITISVDGIQIHDFADHPVPPPVDSSAALNQAEGETYERRMRAMESEGRFMSAITFLVVQDSPDDA
jgi:hypothetical protein